MPHYDGANDLFMHQSDWAQDENYHLGAYDDDDHHHHLISDAVLQRWEEFEG